MMVSFLLSFVSFFAGFYIVFPFLYSKFKQLEWMKSFVEASGFVIGVVALFIGFWSLLKYNIVSDFFPACLSIISGLLLSNPILDFINFSRDFEASRKRKEILNKKLNEYGIAIGFTTIAFSIIHLVDLLFGGNSLFI